MERYIRRPGQALAYMIGRREIMQLRAEAKATMGSGFAIKGFHDTVLDSAPVPLSVLRRLENWAAA